MGISIAKDTASHELDHKALNLNIIQNLASAVEGSTRSLLINHIENSNYYKDAIELVDLDLKAIIDHTLISLYKKPWGELNSLANQLFGSKITEYYSGDFSSILNLFHLRNITAHGGVIIKKIDYIPRNPELGVDSEEDRIEYDNRLELSNYLIQRKLISPEVINQIIDWEYFNNNVTSHFKEASFHFMKEFYSNYKLRFNCCNQIEKDYKIIKQHCDR